MRLIKKTSITAGYIYRHPDNRMQLPLLAAACAVALLICAIFWLPAKLAHKSLTDSIEGFRGDIRRIKNGVIAADIFQKAREKTAGIEARLTSAKNAGEISSGINSLAKSSALKLSIESGENMKDSMPGYDVFTQDIVVSGNYKGLRVFLYGLEHMDAMAVISRLSIEKDGKNPGAIKAGIKLVIYRRQARTAAGI